MISQIRKRGGIEARSIKFDSNSNKTQPKQQIGLITTNWPHIFTLSIMIPTNISNSMFTVWMIMCMMLMIVVLVLVVIG